MKICLVRSCTDPPFVPPIGIAYLTSVLRKNGFDVKAMDFQTRNYQDKLGFKLNARNLIIDKKLNIRYMESAERVRYLKLIDLWCEDVLRADPDIVGFTTTWPNFELACLLANKLKKEKKDILIVFGGPQCSLEVGGKVIPELGVADIIVHGEGEEVMLDIAKNYQNSSTIDFIRGATIVKDGKPKYCGERPPIQDLDTIPFPDFTDFELHKYYYGLPIITSRGCAGSCSFCYHIVFWKKYRERSPENVLKELKHDIRKYGIRRFSIGDSAINSNPDTSRLERICDLIIESGLEITWRVDARVGNLSPSLLAKMRKAGCRSLSFRVGSFNPKISKDMRMGVTPKQIHDTFKWAKENQITAIAYIITGFPTETRLEFMEDLLTYYISFDKDIYANVFFFPMGIYTGTEVYASPQKYGVKKKEEFDEDRLRYKLLFPPWSSKNVSTPELMFRPALFSYLHDELLKADQKEREMGRPGILAVMAFMNERLKSMDKLHRTETMTKIYSELLLSWASSFVKEKDFRQIMAQEFPQKKCLYRFLD